MYSPSCLNGFGSLHNSQSLGPDYLNEANYYNDTLQNVCLMKIHCMMHIYPITMDTTNIQHSLLRLLLAMRRNTSELNETMIQSRMIIQTVQFYLMKGILR